MVDWTPRSWVEGLPAQPHWVQASGKSGACAGTWTMRWSGEETEGERVRPRELGVPKPEAGASLAFWRYGKNTSLFRGTGTAPLHGGVQTAFLLQSQSPIYYCDMKCSCLMTHVGRCLQVWWAVIRESTRRACFSPVSFRARSLRKQNTWSPHKWALPAGFSQGHRRPPDAK